MASVVRQPRSKYWIAAFRDASGKQHRRTTRETDKKRAQAVAEQFERVAQRKGNPQRIRQILSEFLRDHYGEDLSFSSVSDFVGQWLGARKAEISPATYARYNNAIGKFLAFLGPDVERGLEEITRARILAFRNVEAHRSASGTANTNLGIIKRIFRSARLENYLFQDPAEGVKPVKTQGASQRRPFTIDELRAVLGVANPEWQSLIKFGLYTGQRLGDLAALTWAQIDLERDEIRITTRKTSKPLLLPIGATST